jgi:NAD(P)-dependent dehydrogenase (short-subunit alcohol dehydrogenase family)
MNVRRSLLVAGGALAGAAMMARALRSRRAFDFDGRIALITGGSRGLGLLIARQLGHEGAHVVLVARDIDELERARQELVSDGVTASILVADVSVEREARRVVEDTVARHGRLDILVNNAGVITVGPAAHMGTADFDEAMATHFWAPFHAVQAALPHMKRAGAGRIVNISSIGGRVGVPHLVPYCASKFALTGFSTAIRAELAQHGILVTTVCPGLMRTGSPFNAWFKGKHREEFAWFVIAGSLPLLSIDGRRAAAQIVDATRHGDAELVVAWSARVAIAVTALAPNVMAWAMDVANRFLPSEADDGGEQVHSGWQSASSWAPSRLTRLTERSAAENNELPPRFVPTSAEPVV